MKLAVIGSRNLQGIEIDAYIPEDVTEIVSGGARGVDTLAKAFASRQGIKLTEFLPQYELYGRAAPLKRNQEIAAYADQLLALWDGVSKGTAYTVKCFERLGKKVTVVTVSKER